MIEQILRDTAVADSELSIVLLRYFNPIGAHESGLIGEMPQGIPNNLLPYVSGVAAGTLEKLHVFGNDYPTPDGTGVRDYIHVVDLAKGHLAALQYADVLEIVNAFERANQVQVPYEINDRRPGDVAECYADTSKAERLLHWKAERDIEQMCRDAWRWQTNLSKGCKNDDNQ